MKLSKMTIGGIIFSSVIWLAECANMVINQKVADRSEDLYEKLVDLNKKDLEKEDE